MVDALIIIPTLNEAENIAAMLKSIFALKTPFHILVVDDNSQDGTKKIVENLKKQYENTLFLENRLGKKGLGKAYIDGFKWALQKNYAYILEMDADFSHDPKYLPMLYKTCKEEGFDMSIGSRYIGNKINVIQWDFKRLLLSFFASKYVKFITKIPIYDTTAGFVCYKKQVLEAINLEKIQFIGYAFQIEMKFKTWKKGFKIKEIPIVFRDRTKGISKMNGSIIREAIFGVIQLRFNFLKK